LIFPEPSDALTFTAKPCSAYALFCIDTLVTMAIVNNEITSNDENFLKLFISIVEL